MKKSQRNQIFKHKSNNNDNLKRKENVIFDNFTII